MCGISGSVQRDGVATRGIDAQLACQRHRGPDAEGYFDGGRGVVGQNRLSIIDLVHGDPPLTNEDGTVGAVLNGEIYNFREIRDELRQRGHHLSSAGDTEVLAHLAEDHDAVGLARALDGMFAFATWDRNREQLVLGRDRTGKKPLYYWRSAGTFVFSSEIKGVLAHPDVSCEPNEHAIDAYLTFGYVPTPYTFFDGIKSLPPAHVLTVTPGGDPRIERYWRLQVPGVDGARERIDLGLDEAGAEIRRLLQAAIQRRLIADVPLGAFLSGGIDSSSIVALMAGVMGEPVKTFTIGFSDRDGYDERPYARMVAQRYGTEHYEEVVHPEAVDLVERLVWHHDQPFGDSSAIPTFILNEITRKHVTVALAGDGGDELFAGYERFPVGMTVERLRAIPEPIRRVGRTALGWLPESGLGGRVGRAQRFAGTVEEGTPWAFLGWVSYVSEPWRQRLLKRPDNWGFQDYARRWQETAGARTLDRLLALNIETYLLDDLLVKMDRMSMAHALEIRSPFLDTQLLEFATRLAPSLKIRGFSMKRVLKHAFADFLPAEILSRPKRGFSVPLDRWFREDLDVYTQSMLGAGARVRAHVDGSAVDQLLSEHRSRSARHGHALWTLLTLELFLRRHGW